MARTGTYIEANGLKIYYEAYGEGTPLVLIHGGTATSQAWASRLPAFAKHFQVFAPDSRGHGRTDNPTGELGYRVMADDVVALVGAEFGVTTGSELQRRRADRPRARHALPRVG
jgi:pimeloyl-ACP methyl ester carboxylesterase